MPMTRMLTRITSMITIFHMTPLLRSEEEVEVRRDTGDISVMVDVECENDRIDPWAEANISAFLTHNLLKTTGTLLHLSSALSHPSLGYLRHSTRLCNWLPTHHVTLSHLL